MNRKRLIISSVISIFLVAILLIGSTYSIFTTSQIDESANVYKTGNLAITYTLSEDNITLSNSIPRSDNASCSLKPYRITITNTGNVPYMFDIILNDTTASNTINYQYINTQVGKLEPILLSETTSNIIKEDTIVPAGSSVDIDIRVWITDTVQNSEIGKSFYAKLAIDGLAVYNADTEINNSNLIADSCANSPNLDTGLIPVHYDSNIEAWKKADSTNTDNSWYNYDEKRWANAILISDEEKRTQYQNASVDTIITDADITAFYVWIPRYKYRVWNITRKIASIPRYAYNAYTYGIDIEWENGTNSTGNVECTYNTATTEAATNLSDTCIYNGTDTITTTSGKANYTDAWYTHPAFTFGDKEIEGFWMGKFETTGTATEPTILPDVSSLRDQNPSGQFTTSKVFQNYGLSTGMDAHMLTNLEWGAVAYLTHSIYGLCDGTSCRGVYQNNSSGYYTGRSGGATPDSTDLNLANVYPDDSTATTKYNTNGYYTYEGYFIDYNGNITTTKDITKVASTTRNITGVYDMSGGDSEIVLGKMVPSSSGYDDTSGIGDSWNGSSTLASKYYNRYSYGTTTNDAKAYNRARLGDATAEVTMGTYGRSAWGYSSQSGYGSRSNFMYSTILWFQRGSSYTGVYGGIFSFTGASGASGASGAFRSSLS